MADLLAGEQPAVVEQRYRLKSGTARDWKRNMKAQYPTPDPTNHPTDDLTPTTVRRPAIEAQQQAIGAVILDLLRAKFEASAAIARHARDNPAWLAEQSAAELAALGQWLDGSAFAIGDRLASASESDAAD